MGLEFRIDWLSFTVFGFPDFQVFWAEFFQPALGPLVHSGHGSRGFADLWKASEGVLMSSPRTESKNFGRCYFSIELSGKACECLSPDIYRSLLDFQRGQVGGRMEVKFSRLDFAFDGCQFSPADFYSALVSGDFSSSASRKSIKWINSPFAPRDNGDEGGCQTCYLGDNASGRSVRVYNRRGFTRLELQCRDRWANALAIMIFSIGYSRWFGLALGAVRDFVEVQADWWNEFLAEDQLDLHVYSARAVSLARAKRWLCRQVSAAFFAVQVVEGLDDLIGMIAQAATVDNGRRLERWRAVMELSG